MAGVSPYTFLALAEAKGYKKDYATALFEDAKPLAEKNLPIIFTLKHLSLVSDVSYQFLYQVVSRFRDPYFHFTIPKQNGTRRIISSPTELLETVQSYIKDNILESTYVSRMISDFVFSYRKKLSIVDNACVHLNAKWVVKIDIKDFFDSFFEHDIYKFINSLGYSSLLSFEMARLLTWPTDKRTEKFLEQKRQSTLRFKYKAYNYYSKYGYGSLPQGAPSSPALSNILFYKIDAELKQISDKYSCVFSRYADDLFFSSSNLDYPSARNLIYEVRNILSKSGFRLNTQKTKIFGPNTRKIVTGIVINGSTPKLTKQFKDDIKKHIFFIEKNGLSRQAQLAGSKDEFTFLAYLYGKINFARQVECDFATKQLSKLNSIIQKYKLVNNRFY